MNLIIVSPFPPYRGGISKESEVLYKGFLKKGYNVKAINFIKLYPDIFFPGKTQYLEKTNFKESFRLISTYNPFTWNDTIKKIVSFNADTVIFRYWHPILIPSYCYITKKLKKYNSKLKIYCMCDNVFPHENFLFIDKYLIKNFLNIYNGIFCMSNKVKKELKSLNEYYNIKNIFLPIKEEYGENISKEKAKNILQIKENKIILFFGLVRNYKGLNVLIKAISQLSQNFKDFKLLIAGECYDSKQKYNALIKKLNVNDKILWIDKYISDNDINLYFSAADMVVLPYLESTQSGIIPIAYNFNKIVVASDIRGLNEFVQNGKTGFLFKRNDSQELYEILNKIIHFNSFDTFTKNIAVYKKNFTVEALVGEMINFMDK